MAFGYASRRPSGDHAGGANTYPEISATFRSSFPSAFVRYRSVRLNRLLRSKAIVFPSGDTLPRSELPAILLGAPPQIERFHRLGLSIGPFTAVARRCAPSGSQDNPWTLKPSGIANG